MERDIDALGQVDAFQFVHAKIMQDPVNAARRADRALQVELLGVKAEAGTVRCGAGLPLSPAGVVPS